MMNDKYRILMIDDKKEDFILTRTMLVQDKTSYFELDWAPDIQSGREAILKNEHDAYLIDYCLGMESGLDLIREVIQRGCQVPIIMLTVQENPEIDNQVIKVGAADYLVKDQISGPLLARAIRHAVERKKIEWELKQAKDHSEEARIELEHVNKQLEVSLEKANLATHQALQKNHNKKDLLYNISQEICSPLNSILGFADLLLADQLTETQRYYTKTIINYSNNLLQMMDNILDLSKIEAGQLSVEVKEFSLDNLINEITSFIKPLANEKQIDFNIHHLTPLPKIICTDPIRLRQCLLNLTDNAIKYTSKGHVYIRVSWEKKSRDNYLRFDIVDTGKGIKPDILDKILNTRDNTISNQEYATTGMGLGLAITKELIELLNGSISAQSTPDSGSTFSLVIPTGLKNELIVLRDDSSKSQTAKDKSVSKSSPETAKLTGKVLIAEDNLYNQKLMEIVLKRYHLNVKLVDNGQEAVEAMKKQRYDLVFMDMQMPVMDGFDATRAIREFDTEVTIVALTAHTKPQDKHKCLDAGCTEFVSKPVNQDKLYPLLKKYLQMEDQKETLVMLSIDTPQPKSSENTAGDKIVSSLSYDDELAKIVQDFINDLPGFMDKAIAALDNDNVDELARLSHELKG
ncbi:MAG: response regulator, partial [Sedimentisphaerales bacterium]|nr:response regulator [Sedimentisphaerales bacterium]